MLNIISLIVFKENLRHSLFDFEQVWDSESSIRKEAAAQLFDKPFATILSRELSTLYAEPHTLY